MIATVRGGVRRAETSSRHDLPTGTMPAYDTFCRHVWSYVADDGSPAIGAPPWMYAILLDDPKETRVTIDMIDAMIGGVPEWSSRFWVEGQPSGATQIAFADLGVLHSFLSLMAVEGSKTASEIAEFMVWSLGFRWV